MGLSSKSTIYGGILVSKLGRTWHALGILTTIFLLPIFGNETRPVSGVVIEDSEEDSELYKAGVRVGDIIYRWRRLPNESNPAEKGGVILGSETADGVFNTIFDWVFFLEEHSPRGMIMLFGKRENEELTFRIPPNLWARVEVYPNLTKEIQQHYLIGKELVDAGKVAEGIADWKRIFEYPANTPENKTDIHCWLWLCISKAWNKINDSERANASLNAALMLADGPVSQIAVWAEFAKSYEKQNLLAKACESYGKEAEIWKAFTGEGLGFAQAIDRLGEMARRQGKLDIAEDNFQRAFKIRDHLAPNSLVAAKGIHSLGTLALTRGDLDAAEPYLESALSIRVNLAPGSSEVSASLNNLGNLAYWRGDLNTAFSYYKRTLEIDKKLTPGSLVIAGSLNNLGNVAREMGDLNSAISYHKNALAIREIKAPESLDVSASLNNLGILYGDLGDFNTAEINHNRALKIREKLVPDSILVAESYNNLGNITLFRGQLANALVFFERSLAIRKNQAPRSLIVADSLANLGSVYYEMGDLNTANEYFNKALEIRESLAPASLQVATSYNALGNVAWKRGNLNSALTNYKKALAISENLAPESIRVANCLQNLGNVAWDQGELDAASNFQKRALAIREKLTPNSLSMADSLNNVGNVIWTLGEIDAAEDYLRRALTIREKLAPNSLKVGDSLNNLGNIALFRGDLITARYYHDRALVIRQELSPDSLSVADSLNNLGLIARSRGDLMVAFTYFLRSLKIKEKLAPESLMVAESLNNLGIVAWDQRNLKVAVDYHLQALAIREILAPESLKVAGSLNNLGVVAQEMGDLESALAYHERSLAIGEARAPGSSEEAKALRGLARTCWRMNQLEKAKSYFERSIESLESQITKLGGTHSLLSGFRARNQHYYDDFISFLMKRELPIEAFTILERSRARTFLEMLSERAIIPLNTEAPKKLVKERHRLAYLYEQTQIKIGNLKLKEVAKRETLFRKQEELRRKYNNISLEIRKATPEISSKISPEALNYEQVCQVLEPGTVYLSYRVTKDQTFLFIVRAGQELVVHTINKKEKYFEDNVRALLSLFSAKPNRQNRISRQILDEISRELFNLLITPVAAEIAKSERLLISADGPLWTLPFHLLKGAFNPQDDALYLIEWLPICNVLSGSVYAQFKIQGAKKNEISQIIAFGDPAYPWAKEHMGTQKSTSEHFRLRHILNSKTLAPLPFTADEVIAISKIFPSQTQTFLGEQATEARVKSLGEEPDIIHLALHGFLDKDNPLDSALVLSIPESFSEGDENGVLQAWEILESVRIDASLVVLSACNTGLGDDLRGEGLIGLTRALQVAGALTVMASLWEVQDETTAIFMKQFYSHLKEGLTKDEALRKTQIEFIRNPIKIKNKGIFKRLFPSKEFDASHPFFWAAFHLNGRWN